MQQERDLRRGVGRRVGGTAGGGNGGVGGGRSVGSDLGAGCLPLGISDASEPGACVSSRTRSLDDESVIKTH